MTGTWSPIGTRELRVGLIGLGSMGRNHLRVLRSLPAVRLAAIVDPDEVALSAAANESGAQAFTEPMTMLAEAELDAVVIAAPTTSHLPLTLAALEHGIAVLVEKPLAATPAEAERIVAAASAPGAPPVQVGHIERFNPAVLELGRLLEAGWLSSVYAISSRRSGPFPARIRDVGVTVDLATHDVDILCAIAGERPARVSAETAKRIHADHEDLLFGLMSFPSGVVGMLDVDWLTPAKRRWLNVVGEEGMFELDYLSQSLRFARATDMTNPRLIGGYAPTFEADLVDLPVATGEPLAAELEAFVSVVREGTRPLVGAEDGRWAVVLAHALLEAARDRRTVELVPRVSPILESAPTPSLLGGSIDMAPNPCRHAPARVVEPWVGEPGTAGTVAVVGAGKMGLPLAAQFASHGWRVVAVDIDPAVVAAINDGRSHIGEEPGVADLVAAAHADGRLLATADGASAARDADVVVLIVPVMLDEASHPDHRWMDAAAVSISGGLHPGSLVLFETTLPVGDTRDRYGPRLVEASGLTLEEDLFVAFSPERLYSGAALRNLATYPKLVGGLGGPSTARAAAFYASVLDADVVAMSSAEAAEFAKLAETTYRDVNIALANEFARYADRIGVDALEVIAAANSQPYSHIHQPGLGVGGHCIPVYPHFLLDKAPDLGLVTLARDVNDGQVDLVVGRLADELGGLADQTVLVLGLTYRQGVKEVAYSRARPLIDRLRTLGARVLAYDPLLTPEEVARTGAAPWIWGDREADVQAIVTQTADPVWQSMDAAWFPTLRLLIDGRNSLRDLALPNGVAYRGIGRRR